MIIPVLLSLVEEEVSCTASHQSIQPTRPMKRCKVKQLHSVPLFFYSHNFSTSGAAAPFGECPALECSLFVAATISLAAFAKATDAGPECAVAATATALAARGVNPLVAKGMPTFFGVIFRIFVEGQPIRT